MHKELEIWQSAAARLKRGERVVLLVVTESAGSSPGRPGFKMIVARDAIAGSIGGGVMEIALVEKAQSRLNAHKSTDPPSDIPNPKSNQSEIRNPKSEIVQMVHRKNVPQSSGMICSGRQTVLLYGLEPSDLKIVRKIVSAGKAMKTMRLRITDQTFGATLGPPEGGTQNDGVRFERESDTEFVYEEDLGFKQRLYIVGGGHCALALSELMAKMDFRIALFDDREGLNTVAKNRFVHEKRVVESYEEIDEFIPSGPDVYVVVMTLGYKFDETVIRRLFAKDFKYFGVLGSKAKMKTLLAALEKEGFDRARLDRIRTPVGLPINSHTPEEIAVSIAAEIIAVKNDAI
ncbi:MAG: XdhC family protein [Acidobacteria bacterium]|nr:XdhC family protein [Acidobacteriota bacterium]